MTDIKNIKNIIDYVYCINFGDKIKIGTTTNINQRLSALKKITGNKIIDVFYLESNRSLEKMAHKYFKNYNTIGEYFSNIDFSYVCDWLKKNKNINFRKQKDNLVSREYFKKTLYTKIKEDDIYNKQNLEDLVLFEKELLTIINCMKDEKKKKRAIKNINILIKNIKEIYTHNMTRFRDFECLEIQNNILNSFNECYYRFGYKVANNWVYNMKRSCINFNHDFEKIIILSNILL